MIREMQFGFKKQSGGGAPITLGSDVGAQPGTFALWAKPGNVLEPPLCHQGRPC